MNFRNKPSRLTRRAFLQAGCAVAFASGVSTARAASGSRRGEEHGQALSEFTYGQVSLAEGLHESQLAHTYSVLMSLDEDSLLRPFRFRAGLPAPGEELGGWYSSEGFSPGHAFGQWLSGLSRCFAITGSTSTLSKIDRLLTGFAATIEPKGRFYSYPQMEGTNPQSHVNAYTYDKLVCGLMDAHHFAGRGGALAILARATDGAVRHLPERAIDSPDNGATGELSHESYTLSENQFISWQRGGPERHLQLALRYLPDSLFFEPLARGENVLPGRHAYSHVNALCSAAKAYLVKGDPKYLRAAVNGFRFVEAQSYVTGGWGPTESFLPHAPFKPETQLAWRTLFGGDPPKIATLGESILHTKAHFETVCGAYAHFKLTRYLLRITKDSRYGDSMERVMYNTILGAQPLLPEGRAFYHSDYNALARKNYYPSVSVIDPAEHARHRWPCCAGTLPQIAADYRISSYLRDGTGVYVNLYIPSTLRWQQGRAQVALKQSGQYPLTDAIDFELQADRPVSLTLRLRIPAWATAPALYVNDKPVSEPVVPGTFAAVRREWRSGDRIHLVLPRALQLQPADAGHRDLVALVYAPLVLFAVSDETPRVTRDQLLSAARRHPTSHEWLAESSGGSLRLLPWWSIKDETYTTYMSV
jgi:hypothetical protein